MMAILHRSCAVGSRSYRVVGVFQLEPDLIRWIPAMQSASVSAVTAEFLLRHCAVCAGGASDCCADGWTCQLSPNAQQPTCMLLAPLSVIYPLHALLSLGMQHDACIHVHAAKGCACTGRRQERMTMHIWGCCVLALMKCSSNE